MADDITPEKAEELRAILTALSYEQRVALLDAIGGSAHAVAAALQLAHPEQLVERMVADTAELLDDLRAGDGVIALHRAMCPNAVCFCKLEPNET